MGYACEVARDKPDDIEKLRDEKVRGVQEVGWRAQRSDLERSEARNRIRVVGVQWVSTTEEISLYMTSSAWLRHGRFVI